MSDSIKHTVTGLACASVLALGVLPFAKALFEGRSSLFRRVSVVAIGLAVLSHILTCASYWEITEEGLTMADYETGTSFTSSPKTFVLQTGGMALLFLSEYLVLGLLLHSFFELTNLSAFVTMLKKLELLILIVLASAWITIIVGFIVNWNNSDLFAPFLAIVPVITVFVYAAVAFSTGYLVVKHASILQKHFPSENEFLIIRNRVLASAVMLGHVNILVIVGFGATEWLDNDPTQTEEGALLGAITTFVFTPVVFWVTFYFMMVLLNVSDADRGSVIKAVATTSNEALLHGI
ncbi:hypothetical protein HDU99_003774 [Rhizoclosmatium hyalinum]|nr:hypothetical protein HDU99_003774 [Rhizoclosmatium hyalinum]